MHRYIQLYSMYLCFYFLMAGDRSQDMDSTIDSDEALMLRYAEGDAAAFELLYSRHKGPVYRYMLRLCNNEAVAEELFQEVWIKLINARQNYIISAKFTTYLYRLAHNHFIDHYRKQNIRIVPGQSDDPNTISDINSDPEKQVQVEQTIEQFNQVFNSLPQEQREVFLLKEETDMNLHEIAETIGINYEAAKSRLRYAINKLRTVINET